MVCVDHYKGAERKVASRALEAVICKAQLQRHFPFSSSSSSSRQKCLLSFAFPLSQGEKSNQQTSSSHNKANLIVASRKRGGAAGVFPFQPLMSSFLKRHIFCSILFAAGALEYRALGTNKVDLTLF